MKNRQHLVLSAAFVLQYYASAGFAIDKAEVIADDSAWRSIVKGVAEQGRAALPQAVAFLSEIDSTSSSCEWTIRRIQQIDGSDMTTPGDPGLLAAIRDVLSDVLHRDALQETDVAYYGLMYLAQKGGIIDLSLMESYLRSPAVRTNDHLRLHIVGLPHRVLRARIGGTNVVYGLLEREHYPKPFNIFDDSYSTNTLALLPSVANTGPQATYVYATFCKAIMKHENYMDGWPHSAVSNIPPEILTMRVWFDACSNAVTDVDLSKYGISVPGLGFATNAPPLPTAHSSEVTNAPAAAGVPAAAPRLGSRLAAAFVVAVAAAVSAALLVVAARYRRRR